MEVTFISYLHNCSRCDGTENEEEEVPIRRSFSVEDLLDEVEKISNVASGGSKVRKQTGSPASRVYSISQPDYIVMITTHTHSSC